LESNPLSISFAGFTLANPTILASGILGYSSESLHRVAKGGAGAVVTKSVGVEPRVGYSNPTLVQAEAGLINAMGLPNPGINVYSQEIKFSKTVLRVPLIVSVFGYSAEEYAEVAKKAVEAGADAVELNVSCPHVKQTGAEIGQSPKLLAEVVQMVKAIDTETMRPILSNVKGGLSGAAIKPVALRCVYDIHEAFADVPIIGCGGISDWRDAVEFFLAGASAVQVGTAVAVDIKVFQTINKGIETYLRRKQIGSVKEIVGLAHHK
jgi:dihydroorotate dehydrogenase (NAD+) catalytic subunit